MGHVYPDSDLDPVDVVEFWAALARERAVVEGVSRRSPMTLSEFLLARIAVAHEIEVRRYRVRGQAADREDEDAVFEARQAACSPVEGAWDLDRVVAPDSPILLSLAAVYVDHPGCREEWKP